VKNFVVLLWQQIKPPQAFSWQTLVLLSLFSWMMSLASRSNVVQNSLATLGWFFLTLGVGWATAGAKFQILGLQLYPGPWLTGALVSILFGTWYSAPQAALILWPIFSGAIAALPKFVVAGFKIKVPDTQGRQDLITMSLIYLLVSCWMAFYVEIQRWMNDYPSMLADNFEKSAFVVEYGGSREAIALERSKGFAMLEEAARELREELQPLRWREVERWLLPNGEQERGQLDPLLESVKTKILNGSKEADWWVLEVSDIKSLLGSQPRYDITMQATWSGPGSNPDGYTLQKVCEVVQRPAWADSDALDDSAANTAPTDAEIGCQSIVNSLESESESEAEPAT
jgi:hypothetical protein